MYRAYFPYRLLVYKSGINWPSKLSHLGLVLGLLLDSQLFTGLPNDSQKMFFSGQHHHKPNDPKIWWWCQLSSGHLYLCLSGSQGLSNRRFFCPFMALSQRSQTHSPRSAWGPSTMFLWPALLSIFIKYLIVQLNLMFLLFSTTNLAHRAILFSICGP